MDTKDKLMRAVRGATRKLAGCKDLEAVFSDVLSICVEAVGATAGTIYLHDSSTRRLKFQHVYPVEMLSKLPVLDIPEDFGMAGEAFRTNETCIKVIPEREESLHNDFEKATGVVVTSMITTPLSMEDEPPIGVVQLLNKRDGTFTELDADVLETIAAVATMAVVNYHLSEESSRASALIGMGKVSHDIGNLAASLYANLSFAEFSATSLVKQIPSKKEPELAESATQLLPQFGNIRETIDRMVGYSHLISDLAAGRTLRPNLRRRDLGELARQAASYLEPTARAKQIELSYDIEPGICYWIDEGYLFRIVQNLVTNAIKAVNELPHSRRSARKVIVRVKSHANGPVIEIVDTGPGIGPRVIERILSGRARSEWDNASGSGWGTKIVLELAATHQAKIEIDSNPGKGSTFRVRFPEQDERFQPQPTPKAV